MLKMSERCWKNKPELASCKLSELINALRDSNSRSTLLTKMKSYLLMEKKYLMSFMFLRCFILLEFVFSIYSQHLHFLMTMLRRLDCNPKILGKVWQDVLFSISAG